MSENKEVEMLKEKLFDKKENGWKSVKNTDEIFNYANTYMDFMNKSKTERKKRYCYLVCHFGEQPFLN